MKKIINAIVLVSAALLFSVAGMAQAETLRIATEGAYPPFNYIDSNNKLHGFDVDIANALCLKMNMECSMVAQDWEGIIPGLLAKKYDAIVASMSVTPERQKKVSFTNRYYLTRLMVAVPKDSEISGTDPASMKGKKVGAQSSSAPGMYVQDVYGAAGAQVKLYPNQNEANSDLVNGRLDAVVGDKLPMMAWIEEGGAECCKSLGEINNTDSDIGIAVRKEDDALRERINGALAQIMADGTYKEIQSKYFSVDIY